jgi:hypothetical protein
LVNHLPLLFIPPATVHFDFGEGAVDLTNIPGGQLEIDSSQVLVRVIDAARARIGAMNGFRASSQAKDNCAAVAFFLSANCLTSSTTGVFADLVSGEKRGNITFESDSPVQVIPWDEADSQLFASPAAYRRDPYSSHSSAVPTSRRDHHPDTCAIHLAPEK